MKRIYLLLFAIFIMNVAEAQFHGHCGVYYLGTADVPNSLASYSNPDISGVVVRFTWNGSNILHLQHKPAYIIFHSESLQQLITEAFVCLLIIVMCQDQSFYLIPAVRRHGRRLL